MKHFFGTSWKCLISIRVIQKAEGIQLSDSQTGNLARSPWAFQSHGHFVGLCVWGDLICLEDWIHNADAMWCNSPSYQADLFEINTCIYVQYICKSVRRSVARRSGVRSLPSTDESRKGRNWSWILLVYWSLLIWYISVIPHVTHSVSVFVSIFYKSFTKSKYLEKGTEMKRLIQSWQTFVLLSSFF